MGRCACGTVVVNDSCACAVGGSDGIGWTGTGDIGDPYIPSILLDADDGNTASLSSDGLLVPGMLAVTSAARVALAPGAGVRVQCYETDTGLTWVWDGSAWVRAFGLGLLDFAERNSAYSNDTITASDVIATGSVHVPDGNRPLEITVSWPRVGNDSGLTFMAIVRSLADDTGETVIARWFVPGTDAAGGSFVAYEDTGLSEDDWKWHFKCRPDTVLGGTTTIDSSSDYPATIAVKEL